MRKQRKSFLTDLEDEIARQSGAVRRRVAARRSAEAMTGYLSLGPASRTLTIAADHGQPVSVEMPGGGSGNGMRLRARQRKACHHAVAELQSRGGWSLSAVTPELAGSVEVQSPEDVAGMPAKPDMDHTVAPVAERAQATPPAVASPAQQPTPPSAAPGTTAAPQVAAPAKKPEVPAEAERVLAPGGSSDAEEAEELLNKLMSEASSLSTMRRDNRTFGRQLGAMAEESRRLRHQRDEDMPDETPDGDEDDTSEAQSAARPAALGHDYFDRLGEAAQFSNSFNLGSFDLSEQLLAYEAELDRESAPGPVGRVRDVSDDEVARELSLILSNGAPSEAPPGSEAPSAAPETAPAATPAAAPAPPPAAAAPARPTAATPPPTAIPEEVEGPDIIPAAEGLDPGAAATATVVAHLHELTMDPADVVMGRAGWNAYGRPPSGLVEAADHFGLTTANGDVARDANRLSALLAQVNVAALGAAERGPVRIVAHGGHLPHGKPFLVTSLEGDTAGQYTPMDHRELLKIFHGGGQPVPLVLAHA